jgi:hypothetical protein
MKVFRELKIRGQQSQLDQLIRDISASAGSGWSRDTKQEQDVQRHTSTQDMYCFTCSASPQRKAGSLWLSAGPGELHVSNIVPRAVSSLSRDEYNAILLEFWRRFVEPMATSSDLVVELGEADVGIDHWLSRETINRLRSFSASANKATGASHPRDRERWHSFIVAAHDENAPLDPATLARWLHEEGGWSASAASDLAVEYESGRDLLSSYQKTVDVGSS